MSVERRIDARAMRGGTELDAAIAAPAVRSDMPIDAAAIASAVEHYRWRRKRALAFGEDTDLLGEPAWDMMLDLFIARATGKALAVSSVCAGTDAPVTTSLRWLKILEQRGLAVRRPDPADRRRTYVDISDVGIALVRACFPH
ncbi:hypothetical protein BH09PSE4_BH09PSE4_22260 [soil metagenome]